MPKPTGRHAKFADPEIIEMKKMSLQGYSVKKISEKFETTVPTIRTYLKKDPNHTLSQRLEDDEAIDLAVTQANEENTKIHDIKKKMLNLLEKSISDAMATDDRHKVIKDFKGMLDSIDNIQRLNNDRPTSIDETRKKTLDVKFDVAETLKQLDSPEQKKQFLLEQLHPT